MLRSFQVGLTMGSMVSLLVGLFLVFNTVSFAVAQRRREIGTLRAIGVTRAEIASLFAIEAAGFGLFGALLGLVGGNLLAQVTIRESLNAVNNAYLNVNVANAGVSGRIALLGLVMGVVGAVIASLVPSIEAASVPPVDALRHDRLSRAEGTPSFAGRFVGAGVAASAFLLLGLPMVDGAPVFGNLALALIALGAAASAASAIDLVHFLLKRPLTRIFGAPARVALAALVRARRRSGVAAGAVLIGLALVLCLATFVGSFRGALTTWLEKAIPADLFIAAGSNAIGLANTPLDPKISDEIKAVPGVDHVHEVRLIWTEARGLHIGLYAFDWSNYDERANPIITLGTRESLLKGLDSGQIAVSDNFARKAGLHVGDTIELRTPKGIRAFEIAGAIVDYSSDQGCIVMDRDTYLREFGDPLVDSFDVFVKPGASIPDVRLALEQLLADRLDARVVTNADLKDIVFGIVDDFFSLVYVLLFIAVAVGVLGVAGTLLAQVLDRTRELGILRAMGASRGQILGSVALEASLLGLAGALLGVPAGLLMGKIFVDVVGLQATGWLFPMVIPVDFAVAGALVSIAFATLGGLLPARRAAGLDVVEAISYE